MFFFPKHNIVRELLNRSLSAAFLRVCVRTYSMFVCACVCKCGAVTASLNLLSTFCRRGGTSSWSSFKVRVEFLKDTHPVNFTSLFRQRISLLTFSFASPSLHQLQIHGHFLWTKMGGPWRERKSQEKRDKNMLLNKWLCNLGHQEVDCCWDSSPLHDNVLPQQVLSPCKILSFEL